MIHMLFLFLLVSVPIFQQSDYILEGSWKTSDAVMIFSGGHFAFTSYSPSEFNFTYGGSYAIHNDRLNLHYEFHTKHPEKVGTTEEFSLSTEGKAVKVGAATFAQIDDGSPGDLAGAWLFNNRVRNGEMGKPRSADNPRKTMKILSGTRFQWIAYNVETKEFMGTGGGTYTTSNGKYTEHIDFFSRDQSRVGASLEFDYERKGDEWHHRGFSSRGDQIYEIWKVRE